METDRRRVVRLIFPSCSHLSNSAHLYRYVSKEREVQYRPVRVFSSIDKALREVTSKERFILVRPGVYQEHLRLASPLQLYIAQSFPSSHALPSVGAGPKGSVVLKCYNRFMTVLTSVACQGAALRNFTVRDRSEHYSRRRRRAHSLPSGASA